jgi:LAO/AO transport system kinase
MGRHFADSGVFIRSMATRGQLGGLARATSDLAQILDASGTDVILIETVGVGQGEVDIVRTADVCLVVLVPGSGDEVQALKAGIMEIADLFVVNKADREGADRLVQAIAANQSLRSADPTEWQPPILTTTATTGKGVPEVWASIGRFLQHSEQAFGQRRRARQTGHLRELLAYRFMEQLESVLPPGELDRVIDRIAAREIDPYAAAVALMNQVSRSSGPR